MPNRYSSFFTAYNASKQRGNPLTKEEQVQAFTEGRTASLKELTEWELQELTRQLNALNPAPANEKADKMRKSILAIFYSINRTAADAIAWAEKQGVNDTKKAFNEYTTQELYVLIRVAEKIKKDQQTAIRKSLLKAPF